MNKTKAIILTAAVLILALFIPVPKSYPDGTKSYSALAYKIVKWNRPFYKNLMFTETQVYRFPHSLKSVDKLWEGMAIDPALYIMKGTAIKTAQSRIEIEIIEDSGEFKPGDRVDITDSLKFDVSEGEPLIIEYLPEIRSKGAKINKIVDIRKEDDITGGEKEKIQESGSETSAEPDETQDGALTNATEGAKPKVSDAPARTRTPADSGSEGGSLHYIRLISPYREREELPCVVTVKSESDWKKLVKEIYPLMSKNSGTAFNSMSADYNAGFFKEKAIVFVMTQESSGSNSYLDVTVSSDGKEIKLTRFEPDVRTCDMAYWCIAKELDKNHPVFSQKQGNIKVTVESAKTLGKLPGMIASDVHVGRADGNTLQGLKSNDASAVKKIIGKCSFNSPGYDNISDIIIRIEDKQYYYDSSAGIVTVNGSAPNSDKAVKLGEADRKKLNSIIGNYVETGKALIPEESTEKSNEADGSEAVMTFNAKDGKSGTLKIKRAQESGNSPADMRVGRAYRLQVKDGIGWTSYENYVRKHYDPLYNEPNLTFTMEAYFIEPGGEYTETIDFTNTYGELKPGKYRISKNIATGTGLKTKDKTYYAEFTVE